MTEDRWLSTAEAARLLDVKPETIYAYVSRGLLTSVRGGERRGSRFALADLERLAERGREGRRPSGAIERIHTALTLVEDAGLRYRGHPVAELAASASAESVAHLLWTGRLAERASFQAPAELVGAATGAVAALPRGARLTDHVRVAVAAAGAADPLRYDLGPDVVVRRAETILAVIVDTLGAPADAPLAVRLAPGLGIAATDAPLLTSLLVLFADHGLAVSTLAARVAASARVHPYGVVSAGLGAIDGPHHGAASTLAHRLLTEALDDPVAAVAERLRAGVRVPGFGHLVYRTRDPRAELVFAVLRERGAPIMQTVDAVVEALGERPGVFPNVDLALAATVHALGLRPDTGETIFAVARVVGWVAHALEEYAEPGLRFRVEGVYTGPRGAGLTAGSPPG